MRSTNASGMRYPRTSSPSFVNSATLAATIGAPPKVSLPVSSLKLFLAWSRSISSHILGLMADTMADPRVGSTADPTVDHTADPTVGNMADPPEDNMADHPGDNLADPTVDNMADPPVGNMADPTVDNMVDPTVDHSVDRMGDGSELEENVPSSRRGKVLKP